MTFTNFISEQISNATLRIGAVLLGTLLVATPLLGGTAFADAEQDETNAAMRTASAERDLAVVEIHGLDGPVERLLSPAQERDLMALEAYGITDRGGQLAVVADVSQRERDRIVAELHTGSPAQADAVPPIVTDFAGQMERDRMVAELHEGSTGGTAFAVRTDFTAEMERDQMVASLHTGFSAQAEQAAIVVDLSAWQERDLAALEVYALTADGESTPVVVVDLAGWQDRDLRALEIYGIDAQGERTLIVVAR